MTSDTFTNSKSLLSIAIKIASYQECTTISLLTEYALRIFLEVTSSVNLGFRLESFGEFFSFFFFLFVFWGADYDFQLCYIVSDRITNVRNEKP